MIPLHTSVKVKSRNHWYHGEVRRHSKKCKLYEIAIYPDKVTRGGWIAVEEERIEVVEQMELI